MSEAQTDAEEAARPPRPLPIRQPITEGFWDATRRHELVIQRCDDCGEYRHYPQELCPACQSTAWSWAPVSGRGHIYSYVVARQAFHPHWADRVPYVIATVELDEGVRMMSDLDEPPEAVAIGAPVEVFFETVDDEITFPRFRLAAPPPDPAP